MTRHVRREESREPGTSPSAGARSRMRVGCVTRHPYPTAVEIRITKLAARLKERGDEAFVFCPGGRDQAPAEGFEAGRVVRLRPLLPGPLGRLAFSPLPINPVWFVWLLRQFASRRLDVVIVRDLRLALPAFAAARLCGAKAVLDLGEHYPGLMEIAGKQRLAHHLIRNGWLIRQLELLCVKWADLVWVVAEENRDRLRPYARRIEVINNYPRTDQGPAPPSRAGQRPYTPEGEPLKMLFLGLIDNIRGLDLAVEAFALLLEELENVELHLYGDGPFRPDLEARVRRLGIEDKVVFGGWVPEEKKNAVLATGDVALLLHVICDLTQHTLPNKLFDYMYAGLPVVVTRLRPVVRVVEDARCGVVVDDSPTAVAGALRGLLLDVGRREEMARNGYAAVRTRYTWEQEAGKVDAGLEAVVGR